MMLPSVAHALAATLPRRRARCGVISRSRSIRVLQCRAVASGLAARQRALLTSLLVSENVPRCVMTARAVRRTGATAQVVSSLSESGGDA